MNRTEDATPLNSTVGAPLLILVGVFGMLVALSVLICATSSLWRLGCCLLRRLFPKAYMQEEEEGEGRHHAPGVPYYPPGCTPVYFAAPGAAAVTFEEAEDCSLGTGESEQLEFTMDGDPLAAPVVAVPCALEFAHVVTLTAINCQAASASDIDSAVVYHPRDQQQQQQQQYDPHTQQQQQHQQQQQQRQQEGSMQEITRVLQRLRQLSSF